MSRTHAWATWFLASLFYAYQYVLRVAPNVLMDDLVQKYNIDAAQLGQFSGGYYLGYALSHIPLGLLLDRYGPKRIMPLFMLLTVVGMLPLALADIWAIPTLGRVLVGIGSSSAILGLFKIIRNAFAEKNFTWMLSLSVTIGLIGAVNGGNPLHQLNQAVGLSNVIWVLCGFGVLLSLPIYFMLAHEPEITSHERVTDSVISVFKNKAVMAVCFFSGLMVGPLEGFADVWSSSFLRAAYGLSASTAASLPALIFIGMAFGGPLQSLIARRYQSDLAVVFGSGLVMMLAMFLLLCQQVPTALLPLAFFAIGLGCAYQIIAIAYATKLVGETHVGITSATANMIIMVFGYFFHSAIGKIVASFSAPAALTFSKEALTYGLFIVPVLLLVGSVGFAWLLIKSREKKQPR